MFICYNDINVYTLHIRKVVIILFISLFCVYESHIDSKALYDDLEYFKMNVTDAINTVFVYGRFDSYYLPEILMILLKHGDAKITISR